VSTEFHRKVFQLLEGHTYTLKQLTKDIKFIKHSMAAGVSSSQSGSGNVPHAAARLTFNLPCTDLAELDLLEEQLDDERKFEHLVSYLHSLI
jgi:hypothetical protein